MMLAEKEIIKCLHIAKESVLLAGKTLLKSGKSMRKADIDSGRDIKIGGDIQSEKIILNYLKKRSNFSILSEEKGLLPRRNREFIWIVDPLDGSLNYMRRIPLSCVSIGFWQDQTPVLGAVYDFNRDELYSGIVERGAWLNEGPIKISRTTQKQKSVLCTGFPVNTAFSKKAISDFIEDIRSYKKVRLLGSAALSIAYVASGRADVYYEKDIMLWDVAGSIPVLLGAGGKLNLKKSVKKYSYDVYVDNGYFNSW